MPHVVTHAMMSQTHCAAHACRQASHPYNFMACHRLIICLPFMQASQRTSTEINCLTFNTINMQIANENMLERILIAM